MSRPSEDVVRGYATAGVDDMTTLIATIALYGGKAHVHHPAYARVKEHERRMLNTFRRDDALAFVEAWEEERLAAIEPP